MKLQIRTNTQRKLPTTAEGAANAGTGAPLPGRSSDLPPVDGSDVKSCRVEVLGYALRLDETIGRLEGWERPRSARITAKAKTWS
jgi:hypothetical protein